jgi:hypothetical protein
MSFSENKRLIVRLSLYVIFQIASLYIGFFLFAYLLVYIIAIITSAIRLASEIKEHNSIKPLFTHLFLFFVANLILFVIYIPAIIYNPDINWALKGGIEVDPMFMQIYILPIAFVSALIILATTTFFAKLVRNINNN